ncbi:hypothetical protein RU639_013165 [Aspergillus parasiticus]|uniref:Uncharacterized protein n=1 Tax=Aspergillus sergii TaxID=1034303 RepID=A0A5N6WKI8_9EURO|nr:hypothetical protein BDV39DRAFT_210864 [Aspergillus sergii]
MSSITKRFMSFVGKNRLEDIVDPKLRAVVIGYCDAQEKKDPRCKKANLRGTELHDSHDDPTDKKKVISIRFLDENDRRVGTGHLHEDGTAKFRYKQNPNAVGKGFEDSPDGSNA